MLEISGSWMVEGVDGAIMGQHDTTHPLYAPAHSEIPMGQVDFTQVKAITFESQWATTTFDVHGVPDGSKMCLRARVFRAGNASAIRAFMVITYRADAVEIDDTSVQHVMFWLPDGATHSTDQFNSAHVAEYGLQMVWGQEPRLIPESYTHQVQASAIVRLRS